MTLSPKTFTGALALLGAAVASVASAASAAPAAPPQGAGAAPVLSVQLAADVDRLVAGKPFRMAAVLSIAPGWHVNSHTPNEDYLIPTAVVFGPEAGISLSAPVYPQHAERKFAFSESSVAVYEGTILVFARGAVDAAATAGRRTLRATVEYQPCNESQCLAPVSAAALLEIEVTPAGGAANEANGELFGEPAPVAAAAPVPGKPSGPAGANDPFAGRSLPLLLALVFVSGLALNLTPCVYPLIPITLGFFGRQSGGKGSKTFGLAVAYVLGMSVTYSALGVFAALSGSLFGVWLQKPSVIVAIAAVILALALSMFGLFEIQVPHFISDRTGSRGGVLGAASMGLFVGFVAAPCIGPFVLSLLTYVAAKGSAPLGFLLFFTLAMGLGLPYLVLGTAAGALRKLPRSGDWMVSVRKLFGFVLVALAVYFLRPLLPPRLADAAIAVPLAAGATYFLFYERAGAGTGWFKALRGTFVVVLLAAAAVFAVPRPAAKTELHFAPYSESAVQDAARAGRPVMIDFFATWCLPCKELDEKTFTNPKVVEAAGGWVCLKADMTRASDENRALTDRWGVKGMPTIVFLGSDGKERPGRVVGFEPPDAFAARLAP
jgi:thiol:disulfide interchange protein DsbD